MARGAFNPASNSAGMAWLSCTCPPVITARISCPFSFTTAWTLLLRPPRPLRMSCASSPFCAGCRTVCFQDGSVDKQQAILAIFGQGLKNIAPNTPPRPAGVAVVNRGARAITLGQVTSRRTCAQNVEYPVRYLAVIHPLWPTNTTRQQWLDDSPFFIT